MTVYLNPKEVRLVHLQKKTEKAKLLFDIRATSY